MKARRGCAIGCLIFVVPFAVWYACGRYKYARRAAYVDAISRSDTEYVGKVLDSGLDVDKSFVFRGDGREWHYTSLHLAVSSRQPEMVRFLIDRGADLDILTSHGQTALGLAARRMGDQNIGDPPYIDYTKRLIKIIELLVEHNAGMGNSSDVWVATQLARVDKKDSLMTLIARSDDISDWAGPLREAARRGDEEMIELLVEHGAELYDDLVKVAAGYGHTETVRLVLDKGMTIREDNQVLHGAVRASLSWQQKKVLLELLLSHGANPNAQTEYGRTSLHTAMFEKSPVAELLIDHGADIEAKDDKGYTPLHVAATRGRIELVKILLEHGADSKVSNNEGMTPLNMARGRGFVSIMSLLSEQPATFVESTPSSKQ